MTHINAISLARSKMFLKHCFFASVVMSTPMIALEDGNDEGVTTAATDYKSIMFNTTFIESLDADTVLFVLAHETGHMILKHGLRRQHREPRLWNIACDFAINLWLKDCGFKIWEKCCYDEKYRDMSAEAIYEQLQSQGGYTGKDGLEGDSREPLNLDEAERAAIERAIDQQVARAATLQRMRGKTPGALERFINEILNPQVPWYELLRHYMTRSVPNEESWAKRSRRYQQVLPGRLSQAMGEIVIIGDTSGSVSAKELALIAAETQALAEQLQPERIRVIWADSKVAGEQVFETGELIAMKPQGGGGTDMRVPFLHAERYEPIVCIMITDAHTPWPESVPYPVIIACTTDAPCPDWAEVVRVRA